MHQQRSQVRVAALADAQLPHATASAGLTRHQADPGGEFARILEGGGRAHAGDDRRGGHQAHARNLGNGAARRRAAQLLRQATLDRADVGLQLLDAVHLFVQAVDEHRRQPMFITPPFQ